MVFADAVHWIALTDPRDRWHAAAARAATERRHVQVLTSEEVFLEYLAAFAGRGAYWRELVVRQVRRAIRDPRVTIAPQTHEGFLQGLALYDARRDKGYSLVDCISMQTMRVHGVTDVLTHDDHFRQEGFRVLL